METIPAVPITITAISWIVAKISASSCNPPKDVDALVRLLSNLGNSRSGLEFTFGLFTLLVVIGVAIDVFIVVFEFLKNRSEYREALESWEGGKIPSPHRPRVKDVLIGLLGAVLVTVGVAGEFWYEERIGNADTCIQEADNARAGLLEKEAGTAASSSERAQRSADKAEADVETAGREAAAVSTEAKRIRFELGMTELFASSRQVRYPDSLKSKLGQFRGTAVFIRSYFDGDAYLLCDELVTIANSAGMHATNECGRMQPSLPPAYGITVSGPDEQVMLKLSEALSGITAFGSSASPFGKVPHPPILIIAIGFKNAVTLGETAQTQDVERRAEAAKKKRSPKANP